MADLKSVANEVHMKYYSQGKFGKEKEEIKEICSITGANKKEAKEALDQIMHPNGILKREFSNGKELNCFKKDNTVHCPKCKSTSISYDTKKLSIGRGVVGGLIGSTVNPIGTAVGVTVGGLSSKKGYCVCLNCGKRWKI